MNADISSHQRSLVMKSGEFERTDAVRHLRIFPEQLAARADELVLTFRASMIPEIETADCLAGATAVWSLWPGYLAQPGSRRLLQFLEAQHIPLMQHHASGHAYVKDLRRFAAAIAATRLVPIHTAVADRFAGVFERVEVRQNGEWWRSE